MTGSFFSTKIVDISLWNVMQGPLTYSRSDVDSGFRHILYIPGPFVACTFSTGHLHCFLMGTYCVYPKTCSFPSVV